MPHKACINSVINDTSTAIVVPIRCFSNPLSRLADVLNRSQRVELTRRMAKRVLAASSCYPTYIATHDDEVASWACKIGVQVILVEHPGLSAAAEYSLRTLAGIDIERVVIVHADLALAQTLSPAIGPGFVIVPDYDHCGSNVICIPADVPFEFSYGKGSFKRHIAEAERLGLPIKVVDDPKLATDIDQSEDLKKLTVSDLISLGLIGLETELKT